jgi:hypothetical protein
MAKTRTHKIIAAAVLVAAGVSAANAQYYGAPYPQMAAPPPLYPYAVQPNPYMQPYAVPQAYPQRPPRQRAAKARASRTDPSLVAELRTNPRYKRHVVNKTIYVQGEPIIVEKKKYVDDPPRVIERRHYVDEAPAPKRHKRGLIVSEDEGIQQSDPLVIEGPAPAKRKPKHKDADPTPSKPRVIRAEAEVTILGPDRMSIRLFRKRGTDANASALVE